MSRWMAALTVVSSLAIAANAFAAPMIQPVLQHVQGETSQGPQDPQ